MTVYGVLKNVHIISVVISGVLFALRFYRLQRYPHRSLARILKLAPHINDTLLLGAAIGMLVLTGANPLHMPWLSVKLVLLPVYIGLGATCLRAAPGSGRQIAFFVLATLVYVFIAVTALSKNAWFMG